MDSEFIDYLKKEIERWVFRYVQVRHKNKLLVKQNKELKSQIECLSSKEREKQLKKLNKKQHGIKKRRNY